MLIHKIILSFLSVLSILALLDIFQNREPSLNLEWAVVFITVFYIWLFISQTIKKNVNKD
ncbi:MAG: hypothetical protein COA72_08020 [Candidatus Neomarinimicrobiota bacterium]|nr:MAG: hypothetical protein COA72_08020 [Candidatus Neomarinimicrobiota bacterium]